MFSRAWPYAVLVALGLVLYGRTAAFDWSYVDDSRLILDRSGFFANPSSVGRAFREPYFAAGGRGEFYYRPVVTLTYWLDARGGPPRATSFHRTNVLLHLAASLLVFVFLRRRFERPLALGLAVVFAAHPALTEAVAWIPGRTDTLFAIFFVAAWLFWERWRSRHDRASLALHFAAFGLGMLTKESMAVLPAACLAYDALVERRPIRWKSHGAAFLGWVTVLVGYGALRFAVPSPPASEPLGDRALVAVRHAPDLALYLGKVFFPIDLSVLAHARDGAWWPGAAAIAVVAAALVWLRRRGDDLRRPAFGLGLFLLFLAPTLPVSDFLLLENRLYVPLIGIVWAAGEALRERVPRTAVTAALAGCVAVLGVISVRYAGEFRDRQAFAAAAVRRSPRLALAQLTAGNAYQASNDSARAEGAYRAAIALDPTTPVAHNNIGVLALRRGDLATAEREIRAELSLNPTYDKAHYNLGLLLRTLGRLDEAAGAWEEAVSRNPDNVDALGELMVYWSPRDPARAARYRAALERQGFRFVTGP